MMYGKGLFKAVAVCTALFVFSGFLCRELFFTGTASAGQPGLPDPTRLLLLAGAHSYDDAPVLRGLRFDPAEPFDLEFVFDGPATARDDPALRMQIECFLAALTVPREDLWVNLSPYEQDRVMPDDVLGTALGEVFLHQDYLLKQLASSLTHPDTPTGEAYWRVENGKSTIEDRLGKIWVVPDKAEVYVTGNGVFVNEATLGVRAEHEASYVLLPAVRDAINRDRHFTRLRRMYHALILGLWFKDAMRDTFYRQYADQAKIEGIDTGDPAFRDKIYDLYVQSFSKGVYDVLRPLMPPRSPGLRSAGSEPIQGPGKRMKRRFFSGGLAMSSTVVSEVPRLTRGLSDTIRVMKVSLVDPAARPYRLVSSSLRSLPALFAVLATLSVCAPQSSLHAQQMPLEKTVPAAGLALDEVSVGSHEFLLNLKLLSSEQYDTLAALWEQTAIRYGLAGLYRVFLEAIGFIQNPPATLFAENESAGETDDALKRMAYETERLFLLVNTRMFMLARNGSIEPLGFTLAGESDERLDELFHSGFWCLRFMAALEILDRLQGERGYAGFLSWDYLSGYVRREIETRFLPGRLNAVFPPWSGLSRRSHRDAGTYAGGWDVAALGHACGHAAIVEAIIEDLYENSARERTYRAVAMYLGRPDIYDDPVDDDDVDSLMAQFEDDALSHKIDTLFEENGRRVDDRIFACLGTDLMKSPAEFTSLALPLLLLDIRQNGIVSAFQHTQRMLDGVRAYYYSGDFIRDVIPRINPLAQSHMIRYLDAKYAVVTYELQKQFMAAAADFLRRDHSALDAVFADLSVQELKDLMDEGFFIQQVQAGRTLLARGVLDDDDAGNVERRFEQVIRANIDVFQGIECTGAMSRAFSGGLHMVYAQLNHMLTPLRSDNESLDAVRLRSEITNRGGSELLNELMGSRSITEAAIAARGLYDVYPNSFTAHLAQTLEQQVSLVRAVKQVLGGYIGTSQTTYHALPLTQPSQTRDALQRIVEDGAGISAYPRLLGGYTLLHYRYVRAYARDPFASYFASLGFQSDGYNRLLTDRGAFGAFYVLPFVGPVIAEKYLAAALESGIHTADDVKKFKAYAWIADPFKVLAVADHAIVEARRNNRQHTARAIFQTVYDQVREGWGRDVLPVDRDISVLVYARKAAAEENSFDEAFVGLYTAAVPSSSDTGSVPTPTDIVRPQPSATADPAAVTATGEVDEGGQAGSAVGGISMSGLAFAGTGASACLGELSRLFIPGFKGFSYIITGDSECESAGILCNVGTAAVGVMNDEL